MKIERIKRVEPVYKSKDSTDKREEKPVSFRECIKKAAKKKNILDISKDAQTYNKTNHIGDGGR